MSQISAQDLRLSNGNTDVFIDKFEPLSLAGAVRGAASQARAVCHVL